MAVPGLRGLARLVLVALALGGLVGGSAGCAARKVYREATSTIAGTVGEQIIVELAADPVAGYTWSLVGQWDPLIVTLMESDYAVAAGGGGHQRWTFRLVGRGSTTLTFAYGRTWANLPADKALSFAVVVK